MIPLPPDSYMQLLGRVIYAVTYLEGSVLNDLPSIPSLPTEFDLQKLVGQTTGALGRYLIAHAPKVTDRATRTWLEHAGQALVDVAEDRNPVLHARPHSLPNGDQQLLRWHYKRPATSTDPWEQETFAVDEVYLTALEAKIHDYLGQLEPLRVI